MRSRVFIVPLVLSFIAAALYSGLWVMHASAAKFAVEQAAARINEGQISIRYDSLRTAGFPGNIRIEMVRPVAVVHMNPLLKQLNAMLPVAPDGTDQAKLKDALAQLPEWTERYTLDGTLSLSVNMLSDHFRLRSDGAMLGQSTLGQEVVNYRADAPGSRICSIRLERSAAALPQRLWNMRGGERDTAALLRAIRAFHCTAPGSSMTLGEAAGGEPLMHSGPSSIAFMNLPLPQLQRELSFALHSENTEALPAFDRFFGRYLALFQQVRPASDAMLTSRLGSQNADIDLHWTGPAELRNLGTDSAFTFDLRRFSLANALYDISLHLRLENVPPSPPANSYKMALDYRAEGSATEEYDRLKSETASADILDSLKESALVEETALHSHTPQELQAVIAPLIPRLHPLGHMVSALEGSYSGKRDLSQGELDMRSFELSALPYGVTAQAKVTLAAPQQLPRGNAAVGCRNCAKLIDDIAGWGMHLESALNLLAPASGPAREAGGFHIAPEAVDGFKQFLASLAEPKTGDTLTYAIMSTPSGDVVVNGKNMQEIALLFNRLVGSKLAAQGGVHVDR